ncbi:hypothetical protein KM792_10185 [Clostridium tyrobutyricum]|uniref:Uncharacterized protein n=1 Tax=Clostridium tyrobutyricum DIVETGP TaxID=1408889 RepID=W6N9D5_CLOTY|nr:hypothetical protein [Clostridium tyrobutyricum]AND83693.1 hypothetical protein CTK_C04230 [Clostridium tyrobutyricum]MBR9647273.1 hypothetical protein [Clostridium tyrobutyricum]MBV4416781.1 hypothetical protein [Clostridium tyrobutyricum]MBV4419634.1 hypothetical protein [Clostridium tyrobutyricum]MBV4421653.1 hypothetical protein [Clostridium tyrobutyricum]
MKTIFFLIGVLNIIASVYDLIEGRYGSGAAMLIIGIFLIVIVMRYRE